MERGLDALIGALRQADSGGCEDLAEVVRAIGKKEGIDEGLLVRLVESAGYCTTLDELADSLILMRPRHSHSIEVERVALLTMHMAKGLEFPVVFIAGCEEGLIPINPGSSGADVEEERRLFYVAITRATERLYLLRAKRRRLWAERLKGEPSRFLSELPSSYVTEREAVLRKKRPRHEQKGLFD